MGHSDWGHVWSLETVRFNFRNRRSQNIKEGSRRFQKEMRVNKEKNGIQKLIWQFFWTN